MGLTLDDAVAVAASVVGRDGLEVTELARSAGTLVARVVPRSGAPVVVKLHQPSEESSSHVREPAALEVVGRPALLALSTTPPGFVMADLGSATSLADALIGDDAGLAWERTVAWAGALARAHVPGDGFIEALERHAARLGTPVPRPDDTPSLLASAAESIAGKAAALGVRVPDQALAELRELDAVLSDGPRRLSPTDTCPDNCLWTDDGYVLIDYEAAQVRHVAWDVAYLRTPFPSCWCSWAMPAELGEAALEAWKDAFADPYVRTPAFAQDLDVAALGWAFITLGWASTAGESRPPVRAMPSGQARVLHRLAQAPDVAAVPALCALARVLHQALTEAWGEHPLELAPAFRSSLRADPAQW